MTPTVSVAMITYNHERYIAQALESLLAQRVDFEIEVVIGDDCSTDTTPTILADYARKYPDIIRLLKRDCNIGVNRNFIDTISQCRADFIALLEGDDYWTNSHKLVQQANFLSGRPEYALVCHQVAEVDPEGHTTGKFPNWKVDETIGMDSLLRANPIATCSAVFRRDCLPHFPDQYFRLGMGDWPLFVMLAQKGKIGFIGETMAAYRIHGGGVWSAATEITRLTKSLEVLDFFHALLAPKYVAETKESRARLYVRMSAAQQGPESRDSAMAAIRECPTLGKAWVAYMKALVK